MDGKRKKDPIISLIWAQSSKAMIGANNTLPWHLPADLRPFKELSRSKPIVMGRKTFESTGRPLPGRTNIVVSRDASYAPAFSFSVYDKVPENGLASA